MEQFKVNDIIPIGRINYVITKRTKHYITFEYKSEKYVFDTIKRKIHQIDDVEYVKLDRNNAWFSHWSHWK